MDFRKIEEEIFLPCFGINSLNKEDQKSDSTEFTVEWPGANRDNTEVGFRRGVLVIEKDSERRVFIISYTRDPMNSSVKFKDGIITITLPLIKSEESFILPIEE